MDRRKLIRELAKTSSALCGISLLCRCHVKPPSKTNAGPPILLPDSLPNPQLGELHTKVLRPNYDPENHTPSPQERSKHFDENLKGDLYLDPKKIGLMKSLIGKLEAFERYYGHGRFNLIGFDELRKVAKYAPGIKAFTKEEVAYLESMFYFDAEKYGFYGKKVVKELNFKIARKEIVKIPFSGHYLYRGQPEETFLQLRKDIGKSLILTSGIRGIIKQYYLFFKKALEVDGNISRASRSLAPPGYSFHALGDFDVGKVGLGELNFTEKFSETSEFQKLKYLGYIGLRYERNNPYGVRFEPWHIEGLSRT